MRFTVACLLLSLPAFAQGDLTCATPTHSFGRVIQGTKLTHAFVLENPGANPVRIREVKVSCNCTTAPLTTQTIPPAGRLSLPVTFDTSTFEGLVEKSIAVFTESSPVKPLLLALRAEIIPPYRVDPKLLKFAPTSIHAPLTLSVALTAEAGGLPPAVAAKIEGDDAFAVETRVKPDAREIILDLKPNTPPRSVRASLVLVLNDEKGTRFDIPILGELVEDITLSAPQLEAGTVRPGQDLPRRFQVFVNHPQVVLQTLTCSVPWLEASLVPRRSLSGADLSTSKGFSVALKVRADAPAGAHSVSLTLTSTSPAQPKFQIPCTLMVEKP